MSLISTLPQIICIIDDDEAFTQILEEALANETYTTIAFRSARSFLQWRSDSHHICDLIITDVSMPDLSGYGLCKEIRAHQKSQRIPIIILTGSDQSEGKVLSLKYGADDFIQKPFRQNELLAKIQSLLKIHADETERLTRMSRFVSPNIAPLLLSDNKHLILKPHQAEITVLFIDLRRFTAFSETFEPIEVMEVLNLYYNTVGRLIIKHEATLGFMAGDGFMLFLNDPKPIQRHQEAAINLALDIREELSLLKISWQSKGYDIDFGIGIADGKATIGGIGFDQFWQYSVIGYVANLASRICEQAIKGQILASHYFLNRLTNKNYLSESIGPMSFKGIQKSVDIQNVLSIKKSGLPELP